MNKHDPYCRAFYPALLPVEQCTWCYVIRQVRMDEYKKAWDEGYGVGYETAEKYYTNECFVCGYAGEWSTWVCDDCQKENFELVNELDLSTNEDDEYLSLNEDRPKYEDIDKEARARRIQRGIDKWNEDIDIAYWQGYNNALIENDQQESEGTQ